MNIMITCFFRIWHKLRRSIIVLLSCILFLGASGKQAFATNSAMLASQAVTTITPAAMKVLMSNPYTLKHITNYSGVVFLGISGVSAFFAIGMGSNLLIVSKNLYTSIPAVLGTFPIGFVSLNSAIESTLPVLISTLAFLKPCITHPQQTLKAIPGATMSCLTWENAKTGMALATGLTITPADADSAGTGFRYYHCKKESNSPDNTTVTLDLEQCNATTHGYGYYDCSTFYSEDEKSSEDSEQCGDEAYWSALIWNAIPTASVGYFTGRQLIEHVFSTTMDTANAIISIAKDCCAAEKTPFVSQSMKRAEQFGDELLEYLNGIDQFKALGLTKETLSSYIESVPTISTEPAYQASSTEVALPLTTISNQEITPEDLKELVDEASAYMSRNLDQGARYDLSFGGLRSRGLKAGFGIFELVVAGLGLKYLLPILTNVFNAGKLIEYAIKEGFEFIEPGVIKYPDGTIVDVNYPGFKANSTIIDNDINKKAISSVGVSMLISELTYTVQAFLVSTVGLVFPIRMGTRLLLNYCSAGRREILPPNYSLAVIGSGVFVFGGAVPYFMNLGGAAPAIEMITDYRKAIGDETFTNDLSGQTQVGIAITGLCGFLTFGAWEGVSVVTLVAVTLLRKGTFHSKQ